MKTSVRIRGKIALILIISALCAIFGAAAEYDENYTKTAMAGALVEFTKTDIVKSIGSSKNLAGIRITALPPANGGTLKLEGRELKTGDEIPMSKVSKLKFIPSSFEETRSTFTFLPVTKSGIVDKNVSVDINLVKGANKPPEVTNIKLETFTAMPLMGHLNAYEPDGERIAYRISEYPDKGDLEINEKTGVFVYYPFDVSTGKDGFKWYAFDENGNISKKATVSIKINKASKAAVTFSDMIESAAHYQAISLVKEGIMSALNDNGEYLFAPGETMSRAEFIVAAAKAMGAKTDKKITATPFADDADIKDEDKPYIWYSLRNNIVTGYPNDNLSNVLRPDSPITPEEAAVIVNRFLKLEDSIPSATASSALTPAWARQAVINLKTTGIIKDTDKTEFDRESAAEMLYETIRYNKENSPGLLSWAK